MSASVDHLIDHPEPLAPGNVVRSQTGSIDRVPNGANGVASSVASAIWGDFGPEEWLPDMDSNHDKQIQRLLCYHYTIGQPEPKPRTY